MSAFAPAGATVALTLNGTNSVSGAVTVPNSGSAWRYAVVNTDTAVAFIKFGASGLVATSADFPVPPNVVLGIDAGQGNTHAAIIAPGSATGVVYITPIYLPKGG